MVHYGLYSLLGRGEWVQFDEKILKDEYEKLINRFDAKGFDANRLTSACKDAGMRYVNFVVKHHDGFCLWDTQQTNFKSTKSAAKRDLFAEVAKQCDKKGLGLFITYSHGRDWFHSHAPKISDYGKFARPHYDTDIYKNVSNQTYDINKYVDYMKEHIKELFTNYGAIAGVNFIGLGTPLYGDHTKYRTQEIYNIIKDKQPQALISYKSGLLATEDYITSDRAWRSRSVKPMEIIETLQAEDWGYNNNGSKHRNIAEVKEMLKYTNSINANLLLNIGLLPSGEIHPDDKNTLNELKLSEI